MQEIETARGWIEASRRIVVLTGAGISTDSGIQDFRGPKGLWTKNPAAEKMASIEHYLGDPAVRRAAWQNRLHSPAWQAKPNAGHFAVAQLERLGKLEALITQNVDGLHQAAGNSAEKVIEIHGTIHEVSCLKCGDRAPMERALERVRAGEEDPPCRSCGGILKSATISFGQSLIEEDLARSQRVAEDCDLLLAVGSTLGVYPAAGAVPIAQQAGARIVILNAEPTELDHLADVLLRGSISQILPQLVAAAQ
ncbi:MAG: NAD-dependent deacylase [Myxococcota bacterium]|jgi:NAD-dependent deacetylase